MELFISLSEADRSRASQDERGTAGQLALEIMHEIRNPIEALGYLNFLALEDANNPEQVRKYLELAQEQIATLTRIANQTLSFAKTKGYRKRVDLVEVGKAALRIHQQTIEAKKIHLVKDLPADLPIQCHPGQMQQVISNLIVNALDALPEGGKLSLRFSKRQGHIHVLVADNGHGIPKEHQDRIFERFFTTKGESGNGLGLALSKRIVEEHQGKLCFRTTVRPSQSGTAFKICLPG